MTGKHVRVSKYAYVYVVVECVYVYTNIPTVTIIKVRYHTIVNSFVNNC